LEESWGLHGVTYVVSGKESPGGRVPCL
jgi:hypothetical protein